MEFSGERCIPGRKGLELLELEHRARYAAVADRCAGGRVLDLGSGAGYGTDMLAASAAHVLGVDISEEAVTFATEAYGRANARFIQADLCADDFADIVRAAHPEPFDAVTCFEVIEHVAQPQKLLRAVRSLLAPDGLFFVSTPNIDYAFDMEAVNPHHVIEYNLPEFGRCLGAEFRHVIITGQKVHLLSTVGCADGEAVAFTDWRDYGDENHVKYYAAVCSNGANAPEPLRIALRTSDAHLKILQSKLREVRKDQEVKGQRIRLLEAHLAERKEAGEAARQDEVARLREDIARIGEELRAAREDRQQLHEALRQARDMRLRIQEDLRRVEEEGTMGAVKRINQLRRDFEAFKNHPAVRRLLRLRTPGLKLLGLLGMGPGRIAPLAPSRPAPHAEAPEKREDSRPFDQILQDRTVCRNGADMPILGEKTVERLRGELMRRPQDALVSVIMPAWNRAETIGRAVESVLAQSYANWELIVVDDGSDDGTPEAVQAYHAANPKVRLLRIAHEGVSAARDAGLREAKGDLIAYLDSDNRWRPDYLLFSVHALLETGAKCGYSVLEIVDEDARNAVSYRARRFDLDALLKNNYIDINIYVHRRELFEALGGFDRTLRRWVDWDVILRQTTRHEPVQIPAALCVYHRKRKLNQITLEEPQAYKFKVLNKHLIDWEELERDAPDREAGRVSIIIPVYNLPDLTRQCVESIHAHAGAADYEVVLVDNGSGVDASEALRALAGHPRVFLLSNYENYMFALGNNLGAAGSSGDLLVFLNNDTRVTPGWLETLTAPLRDDPSVGMAGPKLLYEDGTVQAAGMAFSDRSVIPYHIYQGMPGGAPCVNRRRTFQALTAACVALRAEDFLRLRGFDPIYVNGGEDLDLCFRMTQELKKKILYVPESTVYHLESKTPGRSKAIRHNRATFHERWGEAVRPDDHTFFAEDGFRVREYVKRGNDPDGPTASYVPVLETGDGAVVEAPAAARPPSPSPVSVPCDHFTAVYDGKYGPGDAARTLASLPAARILVVKPSGIGNMVMFRPAMRALRSLAPGARVTVACYAQEAEAISDLADGVLALCRKHPQTGAVDVSEFEEVVRSGEFDLAVYPPFTNLSRPTPWLSRAVPVHVVHPEINFPARHEVLHNLDVMALLGWEGAIPSADLPGDAAAPERFGIPAGSVGIHCGASGSAHMQKKRWPLEHWAALLDMIPAGVSVVCLGGPGEEGDNCRLVDLLRVRPPETVRNLAGRLTLAESAGVIRTCRLFISNDSGLMHVAAAVGTPVAAVFGPTLPMKNGPWAPPGACRVLQADVPCGPCYAQERRLFECADQVCLKKLAPEDVYAGVMELVRSWD